MDTTLTGFLSRDYPQGHNLPWDSVTMSVRCEQAASVVFELKDKMPTIIQPEGKGVSIIRRGEEIAEIIDIEGYTSMLYDSSGKVPNSCDFIISPIASYDYVIFNELSCLESKYVLPHPDPVANGSKEGKRFYSKKQIRKTIERFYEVNNILDQYDRKIALFSCRLTDKSGDNPMRVSHRKFSKTIKTLEKMTQLEDFIHGFKFTMRVYNNEYRV